MIRRQSFFWCVLVAFLCLFLGFDLITHGLFYFVGEVDSFGELDPTRQFSVIFSLISLLETFFCKNSLARVDDFKSLTFPTPLFLTASPIHAPPV
jgi:Na+/melibiose symporter-like transporter